MHGPLLLLRVPVGSSSRSPASRGSFIRPMHANHARARFPTFVVVIVRPASPIRFYTTNNPCHVGGCRRKVESEAALQMHAEYGCGKSEDSQTLWLFVYVLNAAAATVLLSLLLANVAMTGSASLCVCSSFWLPGRTHARMCVSVCVMVRLAGMLSYSVLFPHAPLASLF